MKSNKILENMDTNEIFEACNNDVGAIVDYLISKGFKKGDAKKCAVELAGQPYTGYIGWKPTNKINGYLQVNDDIKQFALTTTYGLIKQTDAILGVYSYSDLVSYEVVEDGNSVSKGGLGMAVAGGALLGSAGAIVGSNIGAKRNIKTVSNLSIKLVLRDINSKPLYIDLIKSDCKRDSAIAKLEFEVCAELTTAFAQILEQNKQASRGVTAQRREEPADEIRKYKSLLDDGIITEDEFGRKKKELLGL